MKTKRKPRLSRLKSGAQHLKTGRIQYAKGKMEAAIKEWRRAARLGNEAARWILRELAGLN
jgi:hypothetical protein